jgi:surface-anchored protein
MYQPTALSAFVWTCGFVASLAGEAAATPIYKGGHADIGAHYSAMENSFDVYYRFGSDCTTTDGTSIKNSEIASTDVVTRVPNPAFARPEGAVWDFVGVALDEPVWYIPQTQSSQRPFLGFATDSLLPPEWSGPLSWSLESIVSRPDGGEVSLWQSDFFGNPSVKFASADGIDDKDAFPQGIGGHDHYNWGFSKPGVYQFEIGVTGTRIGHGVVHSATLFTFHVGLVDGDYNRDGAVDAADYTVWRDALGQAGSGLPADGNNNREVDAADYDVWKPNYGNVPPAPVSNSGGAATSVPEPAMLGLVLGFAIAAYCGARNHRSR